MRSLIDRNSTISLQRQCELLGLSRSSFYYQPIGESSENLELMQRIDKQYLETPFYGVGQFTSWLCREGYWVNHKRVRRLLRLMALSSLSPECLTDFMSFMREGAVRPPKRVRSTDRREPESTRQHPLAGGGAPKKLTPRRYFALIASSCTLS